MFMQGRARSPGARAMLEVFARCRPATQRHLARRDGFLQIINPPDAPDILGVSERPSLMMCLATPDSAPFIPEAGNGCQEKIRDANWPRQMAMEAQCHAPPNNTLVVASASSVSRWQRCRRAR